MSYWTPLKLLQFITDLLPKIPFHRPDPKSLVKMLIQRELLNCKQKGLLRSRQPRDWVQSANNSQNLALLRVQTLITRNTRAYIQESPILNFTRQRLFKRAANHGLTKNLSIVPHLIITLIQLNSLSCSMAIWIKRPPNFPKISHRSQVSAKHQAQDGTILILHPHLRMFLRIHKVSLLESVSTKKSSLVNNVGAIKHRSGEAWETVGFFSYLIISRKTLEMPKSI